jgi:DNA-binding transcriptional LysR family regulator
MTVITNGHEPQGVSVESVYLKTLVEVVRTGSLSRAAEILCVTQPAVSRRIKFLEDQYGCSLLDRSGPKLRPTESGKMVFQKAKALLEIEADLEAGLHRLEGKTRLSFSCTPAFGTAHLPAILKDFMLGCADTADLKFLFLTPDETLRGLGESIFDIGVVEGATLFDLTSFVAFPLPTAETFFMTNLAPGVPPPGETIDTLLDIPLFTRREGCCSRMLLEHGLRGLGLDLQSFKKVIILDDLHMLSQAVLTGEGTAFLPSDVVGDHLAAGRMTAHRIKGFTHSRTRTLVVNQKEGVHDSLARLTSTILSHFGLPGQDLSRRPMDQAESAIAASPEVHRPLCPGCTPLPDLAKVGADVPSPKTSAPTASSRPRRSA